MALRQSWAAVGGSVGGERMPLKGCCCDSGGPSGPCHGSGGAAFFLPDIGWRRVLAGPTKQKTATARGIQASGLGLGNEERGRCGPSHGSTGRERSEHVDLLCIHHPPSSIRAAVFKVASRALASVHGGGWRLGAVPVLGPVPVPESTKSRGWPSIWNVSRDSTIHHMDLI